MTIKKIMQQVVRNTNNQRDEKAKQLDKDIIIGEEGRDFIFGVAGDDEVHTGYKNEHTIKEGNNQAGDWAIGGEGDDFYYVKGNKTIFDSNGCGNTHIFLKNYA